ncbi:unnamed protein product [Vitrella brassicaformis CCMP3155]|uniref:TLDc domain-containing protein n=2 Tax=Vitrella brassicaformis TaxID=1169539 RepID=A0A0G4E8Y7_VITBC|nr:unnamed protein product [Vitrella brassicaformis CCMP3155]|mmetsp:Transcript_22299/g.63647  ORF Transcript_22299/g.63647 Transcript_22299/m.63647 type:complete len:649 (+) Transcript_22299:118-2064(+)|eukprot:CEL91983.1 unnamed protein product [Vitrella brassicaformis CCMP3155]
MTSTFPPAASEATPVVCGVREMDSFMSQALRPVSRAQECIKAIADELERSAVAVRDEVENRGGSVAERDLCREDDSERTGGDELLPLDVGGFIVDVRRSTLTCLPHTVLAELFSGRWDSAFLRTPTDRLFLDVYPPAFMWLIDSLIEVQNGHTHTVELPPDLHTDPSYALIVDTLMQKMDKGNVYREREEGTLAASASASPALPLSTGGLSRGLRPYLNRPLVRGSFEGLCASVRELERLLDELPGLEQRLQRRFGAVAPFLRDSPTHRSCCHDDELCGCDEQEDRVVSVKVLGTTVATRLSTVRQMGDTSTIYNRFCRWPNEVIQDVPLALFQVLVDVCRRQRLCKLLGRVHVAQPYVRPDNASSLRDAMEMYGLCAVGGKFLPLVGSRLLKDGSMVQRMIEWIADERMHDSNIRMLYTASEDGWRYPTFLRAARCRQPLIILCQAEGSGEIIGVYVSGCISEPDDKSEERITTTQQTLFKLKGPDIDTNTGTSTISTGSSSSTSHSGGIGKFALKDNGNLNLNVAAVTGAVKGYCTADRIPTADTGRIAFCGGRLWLGYERGGVAAINKANSNGSLLGGGACGGDLRIAHAWVWESERPKQEGRQGAGNSVWPTLGSRHQIRVIAHSKMAHGMDFRLSEIEVVTVE